METPIAAIDRRPWEALPAELGALFRPRLQPLADEILEAVRASIPAYDRPLEGVFGEGLRNAVFRGLEQFVELVENPGQQELPGRSMYVGLGRLEAREGRTLESLLSAYRIGARLAWRKIADEGREVGLDADTLALLAEAIFAYIDEMSADSAKGWAEERSAAAGEMERRRSELVGLLTRRPRPDPAAVEAAAREAGWPLPAELAVIVWTGSGRGSDAARGSEPAAGAERGRNGERGGVDTRAGTAEGRGRAGSAPATRRPALPPDAIAAPGRGRDQSGADRAPAMRRPALPPDAIAAANEDGSVVAVVPDAGAPARRAQLERALAGHVAAIGPVVPWTDAASSARRAREAHRLLVVRVLGADGVVAAEEHLPELLLHADPTLLDDIADRALAPLAHRSPAARRRLAETLRALLDHQGSAPEAAAALHVHPQTVRYRLAQLREDFGDALDDPDRRFELALALRA